MIKNKLNVSSSPHLHCGVTTSSLMLDVIIALAPAFIMSFVLFGPRALLLTAISVASCVLFEYFSRKIFKRSNTIGDLSAVVTGLLLAFNLPVTLPWWMVIIGAFVAIVVVKQFFGGIGQNFVNPALVGRITLMISFPGEMSNWIEPFKWSGAGAVDAVSSATPLKALESGGIPSIPEMLAGNLPETDIVSMLLGIRPGCLGETCIVALMAGFIYLVVCKVISPVIPLVFMGTTVGVCWIAGLNPIYTLLSGGLVLGAVFMATDYTTSPINFKGKIIYAIGCGLITALIRLYANLPEGVSFAIIIMNILVPHIENLTTPKPFGYIKPKKVKNESEGSKA